MPFTIRGRNRSDEANLQCCALTTLPFACPHQAWVDGLLGSEPEGLEAEPAAAGAPQTPLMVNELQHPAVLEGANSDASAVRIGLQARGPTGVQDSPAPSTLASAMASALQRNVAP